MGLNANAKCYLYENMHIADDVCSDLCDKPNFGKKLWSKMKFIFLNLSERHTAAVMFMYYTVCPNKMETRFVNDISSLPHSF